MENILLRIVRMGTVNGRHCSSYQQVGPACLTILAHGSDANHLQEMIFI